MDKGDHASVIYGTHFPNRLFVGCLPPKATADHLGKFFRTFGNVMEAKVVLDDQRRSRRFGFVSFSKAEEAERVLKQGSVYLMGKKINVGPAVKKESKDMPSNIPVRIVETTPVVETTTNPSKPHYTYTFPSPASNCRSCETSPIPSPPMTPPRAYSPMASPRTYSPMASPRTYSPMASPQTYSPMTPPRTYTPPVAPSYFYPSNSVIYPSCDFYTRQNDIPTQNVIYMPLETTLYNQPSFLPQAQQLVFIPSY